MLTIRRFAALAASYGADLDRWPETARDEAKALSTRSPEARALLAEAGALDTVMAVPEEAPWPDAALVRLRLGVEARISETASVVPATRRRRFFGPRWLGLAAGSGLAVVAGLAVGVFVTPAAPSPDIVQMMFQPAPIDILAE